MNLSTHNCIHETFQLYFSVALTTLFCGILRYFAVFCGKSRQIAANCGVLRRFFVVNCCEVGLGLGPLSVWMKMEECTLFVGCTSNFIAADEDDNHIDATDVYVTDESDTTNCVDLDGKHSMNI
jgi:hypothetical protein